jgi:hypothetical protein
VHDAVARTGATPTYRVEPEVTEGTLARRTVAATFQGVEQEAASFVAALCAQPRAVAIRSAVRKPTFPSSWEIEAELWRYVVPVVPVPPPPDASRADRIEPSRLSGGKAVDLRKAITSMSARLEALKEVPDGLGYKALRDDVDAWRAAASTLGAQNRIACDTFRDLLRNPQVRIESIRALDRPPRQFRVIARGALPTNPRLIFGDSYEATLDAPPAQGQYQLVLKRK